MKSLLGVIENFLDGFLNYTTYHSFRRSAKVVNLFLVLGLAFATMSFILTVNSQLKLLMMDSSLAFLMIYFLSYYWVIAKSSRIQKDSINVVNSFSPNYVKRPSLNVIILSYRY